MAIRQRRFVVDGSAHGVSFATTTLVALAELRVFDQGRIDVMAPRAPKTSVSPQLQRVIYRQKRKADRLRKRFGDSERALMEFVRE